MNQQSNEVATGEVAQVTAPSLVALKVMGSLSHSSTRHALVEISPDDLGRLGVANNQIVLMNNKAAPSLNPFYVTIGFDDALHSGEIRLAKGLMRRLASPEEVEIDLSRSFDISRVLL